MWRIRQRRRQRVRKTSERERAHYREHKEHARSLVHERLAFWNTTYACAWNRVAIRNHRSRWGSCSSKGNLNFNYRIIFLPQPLIDYIIVHELCHLLAFNHSALFWNQVARAIPDHRERRAALRALPAHFLYTQ